MRVIKFRAWNLDTKAMTCADDVHLHNDEGSQVVYRDTSDGCLNYEVLMQFTGLHDKNGKEIYEGDILDLGEGVLVVVCWESETAAFACRKPECEEPYCDHLYGAQLCKIAGNIYENPELMA